MASEIDRYAIGLGMANGGQHSLAGCHGHGLDLKAVALQRIVESGIQSIIRTIPLGAGRGQRGHLQRPPEPGAYMRTARLLCGIMMLIAVHDVHAAENQALWRIGKADAGNAEFALAPAGYQQYREDAFFIIGRSDPKRDWPYTHPGPADAWAGQRQHAFTVLFGLKQAPAGGNGNLTLAFVDTQAGAPPHLRVTINGRAFDRRLAAGGGDASIFGEPAKGKASRWEIAFPASLLKAGENEVTITTLGGSWLLYDAVTLEAPAGLELSPIADRTMLSSVRAAAMVRRQRDGGVQVLNLAIRHLGEEIEAKALLDDMAIGTVRLKSGVQQVELGVAPVEKQTTRRLRLVAGDRVIAEREVTLRPPRLREIWLLNHSHVDIGYTHRQAEVIDIQIGNMDKAIELANASAGNPEGMRFKWNPEAIWSIDHYLRRATPEERNAFLSAVRQRQVGLDGLYANMLTGLCRPEELARVVSYAPRLSQSTGVTVDSAAICDVPGYTWGLMTVMAQAGIKYFAVGPNFSDRVGAVHAAWDQKPFYWVSPSGKEKVLCWIVDHYWYGGDLEPRMMEYLAAQEGRDFPYDMGYVYWTGRWPGGGVDNAPPDEQAAQKVVEWNKKYLSPRIVVATASEFFHAFEARHGKDLPSFAGDMTPYWEDGAGSTSRETGLNRIAADQLVQAEALWALVAPKRRPADRFEEAWRNVMLYSEHTWGAWNSISDPDNPFVLDQWKVKGQFAVDAEQQSRKLVNDALSTRGDAAQSASTIDVFNTTQWPRTDLVILSKEQSAAGDLVTDASQKPMPSQRLKSGELAFIARDVPPFGASRFTVSQGRVEPQGQAMARGNTITTAQLSLTMDDRTGAVRSLRMAGLDADLVDPNAPVAINDFRYLLGVDASKAQPSGEVKLSIVEPGPLVATIRIESTAPGCNSLMREVRVIDGLDRVELTNHVDRKAVRQKDAVHFGFGFNVPGGEMRMETPWAVVRPNKDQLPGSCFNWYTVQRWVDVSNTDYGITWAPIEAPLMQIGGMTANLLGAVRLNEWMTKAHDSQTIFSWAQNNHWHTNYKADQPGLTTFRYVLRPHKAGYSGAESARFGVESTRPLITAPAIGAQPPASALSLSSQSVLLETLKVSEDGKAMIVRLFGVSGKEENVTLTLRQPHNGMWLSDLSEAPRQKIEGPITVPAYGLVTVRISLP